MNQSVKLAINRMEPTTKAAQLRQVMPDIEQKLAAGVQLGAIHETLVSAGFDLTFQTLKTYLYRYRKKDRPKHIGSQENSTEHLPERISHEDSKGGSMEKPALRAPISMQDIERLMKPDPIAQAEKLARYERLAKQQRRGQA